MQNIKNKEKIKKSCFEDCRKINQNVVISNKNNTKL